MLSTVDLPIGSVIEATINELAAISSAKVGDRFIITRCLSKGNWKMCEEDPAKRHATGDWYLAAHNLTGVDLVSLPAWPEEKGKPEKGLKAGDIFISPRDNKVHLFIGGMYYDLSNERCVGRQKSGMRRHQWPIVIGSLNQLSGPLYKAFKEAENAAIPF